MELRELLQDVPLREICADGHLPITGVSDDSRTTGRGHVFVAVPGLQAAGENYIHQAFLRGAVCAVCETPPREPVPYVVVPSARRALAQMAANWYGHPARALQLIGVTGTNGKTTVTYLLREILERCGRGGVGLIGTVENRIGGETIPAQRTTPDALTLQRLLRQMADGGVGTAVMEVSSHALALQRVYGLRFDVGVFTNLTQDHLDFHTTMERYAAAKGRLMRMSNKVVYNADDPWHGAVLHRSLCPRWGYGVAAGQLRAEDVVLSERGVAFVAVCGFERVKVRCPIPGQFSVYNALAALGACQTLGVPLDAAAEALGRCHGVPGRMEVVPTPREDITVLIDYAHTPDALENVLRAVRGSTKGRLTVLFGCGGDRDRGKRPLMGRIAEELSDTAIVSSDNPRGEDPLAIIHEVVAEMKHPIIIPDRSAAIRYALGQAGSGDTVLLAGKGHETYQEIGGEKLPLDERDVIRDYFEKKGSAT